MKTASATNTAAAGATLLCRERGVFLALPLVHVIETMRPRPFETLQGMPSFVQGLAIVRGATAPVIAAASLLGHATSESAGRWVSLRVGARVAVLAVEAVVGAWSPGVIEAAPPLLRDAIPGVLAGIGALDAELVLVLETAMLLTEAEWGALAANAPEGGA